MNFYIWLLLAMVLAIHQTVPYKHTGLYMAAAAGITALATLMLPTAPALCMIGLWLVLTALLGYTWHKKSDFLLKQYHEVKERIVRQPPQEVPKVLGEFLVGGTGEITCVFRDGFVQIRVDHQIKGHDIWEARDEKSLTNQYQPLRVGQQVKITGYENQQLIVTAI